MHNIIKKQALILILVFIFLILLWFLVVIINDRNTSKIKEGDITIKVNGDNIIKIHDNFPMTDDMGRLIKYDSDNSKVQAYVEFEVESKASVGTNFEVYANSLVGTETIHSNYIKVYLTDFNNNPVSGYDGDFVPTYYTLKAAESSSTAKQIYYGYIKPGEKRKFILRMWVGDAYTIGEFSKYFQIKLEAK